MGATFGHNFSTQKDQLKKIDETNFDEKAKEDFLKGAKIAYNDAGFSSAAEGCKPEMLKFCTEFSL